MVCPGCQSENSIEVKPRSFSCTSDGCNFVLWFDCLSRLGKSEITEQEASKLISGQQIELKKLVSKTGKKFDCMGELEQREYNGKTGWSVKLIFEQRKLAVTESTTAATVTDDDDDNDNGF